MQIYVVVKSTGLAVNDTCAAMAVPPALQLLLFVRRILVGPQHELVLGLLLLQRPEPHHVEANLKSWTNLFELHLVALDFRPGVVPEADEVPFVAKGNDTFGVMLRPGGGRDSSARRSFGGRARSQNPL